MDVHVSPDYLLSVDLGVDPVGTQNYISNIVFCVGLIFIFSISRVYIGTYITNLELGTSPYI